MTKEAGYECRTARCRRLICCEPTRNSTTSSDQHHRLEDRLHELTAKHYLSEPEQVEEVTLKKKKLQLKDRMEDIMRRHRQDHAHG